MIPPKGFKYILIASVHKIMLQNWIVVKYSNVNVQARVQEFARGGGGQKSESLFLGGGNSESS